MSRLAVLTAAALLVATSAAAAAPAAAQGPNAGLPRRLGPGTASGEPRLLFGAQFGLSQPVHEFRESTGATGIGGGAHAVFRDRSGVFGLRADFSGMRYGRERQQVRVFAGTGRVTADLVTNNSAFMLGVGPQLMAPSGALRPYAHATVGGAWLTTTSSINDRSGTNTPGDDREIFRTTNLSDGALAGGGGGGLLLRLGRGGGRSLGFLDLGARYLRTGRARYLTRGGIRDLPDGTTELDVREGPVSFWTYYVGLSVGSR